jgi:16S rRNA processing protein RimM
MVLTGERERLIPFVRGQIVQDINLDVGVIKVDWAPEF